MKKYLILVFISLLSWSAKSQGTDVIINLQQPGGLEREVDLLDATRINTLKIVGDLNADDLITLRGAEGKLATVKTLDISQTGLTAGDKCYATLYGGADASNNYRYDYYYISDTPRVEYDFGQTSLGAGVNNYHHYCNNLAAVFCKTNSYPTVILPPLPSIGENMFSNNKVIEHVEIPEGVRYIGGGAFGGTPTLKHITIPASVDSIGTQAFINCGASITANCSPEYIATGAFRYAKIASIDLSSLRGIGEYAFYESGLSGVLDLSAIEEIPGYVASETDITQVILSPSATSVGPGAFYGSKLETINLPESLQEIHYHAFDNTPWFAKAQTASNGIIYIGKTAYSCTDQEVADVVIADGTVMLGDYLFNLNRNIREITLPSSVKVIGNNAFAYASSLESISWSDNLETIGERAFSYCSKLWFDSFPESMKSIGREAFLHCSSLTELYLPEGLEYLGPSSFSYCDAISLLRFHAKNLTGGFNDGGLPGVTRITVGPKVKQLPAFTSFSKLRRVSFDEREQDLPLSIAESAFRGCRLLEECLLPDNTVSIGDYAFEQDSLVNFGVFPSKIRHIGKYAFNGIKAPFRFSTLNELDTIADYAFYNASGLSSIPLSESVRYIGWATFAGSNLESLYLPLSVLNSGTITQPFSGGGIYTGSSCQKLKEITFAPGATRIGISLYGIGVDDLTIPDGIESLAGSISRSTSRLSLPVSCVNFESDYTLSGLNIDVSWRIPENYVFEGDASENRISDKWMSSSSSYNELILPEGIGYIGEQAFYGTRLPRLVIPSTLQMIHPNAFWNTSISEIEFRGTTPPLKENVGGAMSFPSVLRIIVPHGCSSEYRSLFGAHARIEELPGTLESIQLDRTEISGSPGDSYTLFAASDPDDLDVEYQWQSTDVDVAYVTPAGAEATVTITGEGEADIIVTGIHSGTVKSATCHVTAEAAGIENVVIDSAETFDIYTVDGIRIMTGADMQTFRNLPKAVYLVNGRKVLN